MLKTMTRATVINRTQILGNGPGRRQALDLLDAMFTAIHPATVIPSALAGVQEEGASLSGCHVFALGKAAVAMTQAVLQVMPVASGLVVALEPADCGPCAVLLGEHPLPAKNAKETGRRVLEWAHQRRADETVLCLLSGGGSAMLELPIEGVSIDDIRGTTELLLQAGAPIGDLNAVRSRLSQLKGGGLAHALAPSTVVNVILSDVPGHPVEVVASGITMPPTVGGDALGSVDRWRLRDALPSAVTAALAHTPTSHDIPRPITKVAANNETAQQALVDAGAAMGLRLALHPHGQEGEAREAGRRFYESAWRRLGEDSTLDGVVCGGESTVRVVGQGRGGRNQEWVLGAATAHQGGLLLSVGTDGIDGASDHAGAFLDGHVLAHAQALGLNPEVCLATNDSARFFAEAEGAIITGKTETNVADVGLLLRTP